MWPDHAALISVEALQLSPRPLGGEGQGEGFGLCDSVFCACVLVCGLPRDAPSSGLRPPSPPRGRRTVDVARSCARWPVRAEIKLLGVKKGSDVAKNFDWH